MLLLIACEQTAEVCGGPNGRSIVCTRYICNGGTPQNGNPPGNMDVKFVLDAVYRPKLQRRPLPH